MPASKFFFAMTETGPRSRRHRRICPVVRLSLAAHRRHETDAQQIYPARSTIDLDWLDQYDRRRLYLDGKQYSRDRFSIASQLLRGGFRAALGKRKLR